MIKQNLRMSQSLYDKLKIFSATYNATVSEVFRKAIRKNLPRKTQDPKELLKEKEIKLYLQYKIKSKDLRELVNDYMNYVQEKSRQNYNKGFKTDKVEGVDFIIS